MILRLNRIEDARKGSILVLAIWSLFFLSVFTLSMGYGIRQKLSLVGRIEDNAKMHFIAEAGIKAAVAELQKEDKTPNYDALKDSWAKNQTTGVAEGSFDCIIVDEERKINLNTQNTGVISRLLAGVAKLGLDEAEDLASAIVDWRDSDKETTSGGAEDFYYRGLSCPYPVRNKNFEVLEELLLVEGMNQGILEKIRPYVTLYSYSGININTADKEVLIALGIKEETAEKILLYRCGADNIIGTEDDNVFKSPYEIIPNLSQAYSLTIEELALLSNLVAENRFVTCSNTFMLKSNATLEKKKGITCEIICVFQKGINNIAYWREVKKSTDTRT